MCICTCLVALNAQPCNVFMFVLCNDFVGDSCAIDMYIYIHVHSTEYAVSDLCVCF